MIQHMIRTLPAIVLGSVLIAAPAQSQTPTEIASNGAWTANTYEADGGKVCFITSQPSDTKPKNVRRGDIYFVVAHRTKDKVRNEMYTVIGYPFKKNSTVKLQIGGSSFDMFTQGDGAWMYTKSNERQAILAMKKGAKMVVTGTSARGTRTVDTYSLEGVTASMEAIDKACN